ncbi:MAG: DUF3592 domain-containing protein [Acidobacteriota bacterium]
MTEADTTGLETTGTGQAPMSSSESGKGCGRWFVALALLAGGYFLALRGLADGGLLVALVVGGAVAAAIAFALLVGARNTPGRLLGVAFLVVALLPLVPCAPRAWLEHLPFGDGALDLRVAQLEAAIEAVEIDRVQRLTRLGVDAPRLRTTFGTPLLDEIEDPEILRLVLDAGFDPEIRDERGRTPLMNGRDPERVRLLLAAGADPNARDDLDRTPLVFANSSDPAIVEALLAAGADPRARDRLGRFVADYYPPPDLARPLLDAAAGGAAPTSPRGLDSPGGLTDWLLEEDLPADSERLVTQARFVSAQQPALGDIVGIEAIIANPSEQAVDWEVEASLNTAAFFVAASHGGRVALPDLAPVTRTVRWPQMHLPPRSLGRLEIEVLARRPEKGDLDVTVRAFGYGLIDDDMREQAAVAYATPLELDGPLYGGWSLVSWLLLLGPPCLLVAWLIARKVGFTHQTLLGRVAAGAFAALLALFVVSMIRDAWRTTRTLEETTCTVLDRRVEVETTSRSSSTSGATTTTTWYEPHLALRYQAQGRTLVSSGFATESAGASADDLERFPIGADVSCFFDPERPEDVVVLRGLGAGSVVVAAVLSLVALGLGWLSAGARLERVFPSLVDRGSEGLRQSIRSWSRRAAVRDRPEIDAALEREADGEPFEGLKGPRRRRPRR